MLRSPVQIFTFQDMPEISRNEVENGSNMFQLKDLICLKPKSFHRDPHATHADPSRESDVPSLESNLGWEAKSTVKKSDRESSI